MSTFYTYLHKRNDSNEVFYVGKGKDKRAFVKSNRNIHWKNIVNKHGYTIQLLNENLTELQAHKFEEFWIQIFGRQDLQLGELVNYTEGGEGSVGYRHKEDSKAKMSESRKGIPTSELQKEVVGNRYKGKTGAAHNRSMAVNCRETDIKYLSQLEAQKAHNLSNGTVSWSIKNNKPVKGMHFEFSTHLK